MKFIEFTNREFKELKDCLIYLQLELLDKQERLSDEGYKSLTELKILDNWCIEKSNETISSILHKSIIDTME